LNALTRIRHWPASARVPGFLATVILMTLLPHATHLPPWIPLLFVALTSWRLWIEVHAAALPPRWLRSVMALSLTLLIALNFRMFNGLEAGTALLSVMAGMKFLESRSIRDYTVIIFIAFFLLFSELLYAQSLAMLPYLMVCALISITALMQLHLGEGTLTLSSALRRTSRMLLQALPLTVLLFLLVPRLPGQFWVLPTRDAATSGLSDEMSPGDVIKLMLSDEVAFRVEFTGDAPLNNQMYWRAIVLHEFDGRTWRRQRGGFFAPTNLATRGTPYRYRMLLEPTNLPFVPALDMPLQSDLRRSFIGNDRQLMSILPIAQLMSINMVSAGDYQLDLKLPTPLKRIDTFLPGALNPRARALVREWHSEAADDAAYLKRLLQWFHTQAFYYTLEPPVLGVNSIDDFLFNTRRGFCEHYASALAFLLRAADIPARVVTGYQGGEYNPLSHYWVIRQSDAHAWVEVWLQNRGWVRVDPTAAIASDRVEKGLNVVSDDSTQDTVLKMSSKTVDWLVDVRQRWDAVNTFWKERIVNFNSDEQRALLDKLGFHDANLRTMATGLLIAFVGFFLGLTSWLAWKYRPTAIAPEVKLWRALTAKLAQRGVLYQAHEGPVDYLHRAMQQLPAHQSLLGEICSRYVALRYEPAAAQDQLRQLRALIRKL
jgi:protein-glutamine gamma-glutamyltransferase